MKVSVIIATADRPGMVLDCIRSFKDQVPSELEVIIVDGGVEKPVDEAAINKEWQNSRVIKSSIRNAGVQRNTGVKNASGDIIIFLDDDVIVQPGWWPAIIEDLVIQNEDGKKRAENTNQSVSNNMVEEELSDLRLPTSDFRSTVAVAGAVWVNPSPEFTDERGGYISILGEPVQITHRSSKAPRDVDWALTTNMAVRKDVFFEVGGFSEVFGIYDEDVDLGLKIVAAGYGMRFQPAAAVYHYYLKRGPKPVTYRSEFMFGRNRSMMLVRNFGLLSRVWLFVATAPWIRLWGEITYSKKRAFLRLPYLAAYAAGTWKGVLDGLRYPVSKDKALDAD